MAVPALESNGTTRDTEALYREHRAAVAALCGSLLRDRTDTEDATQQVFLSAHRALLNGAAPREPRAWLLAVARHECYARFRDRASTPVPSGDAPEQATADASVHVLRAGELDNVWDEVGRMPPAQREAFLLREIRGLSYVQLADELSLSGSSVRSLLLRARTRLRQRLGDVAAGVGGAPWVQALLRLFAGGDGTSPVPAATKAAAVGIGALALAGGGGLAARHAVQTPRHTAEHHRAHVQRVAAPAVVTVAPRESRQSFDDRSSEVEHSRGRDDGSRGSRERDRGRDSRSSGESSSGSGSGHDGSNETAAVAKPSTDGPGGGGDSSSGPGPGDGSGSVTTATSSDTGSGGPGPSNPDSSGSNGSGGGDSHGSDGGGDSGGGSGHDG